jgi:hypothetical protein
MLLNSIQVTPAEWCTELVSFVSIRRPVNLCHQQKKKTTQRETKRSQQKNLVTDYFTTQLLYNRFTYKII